MVEFYHYTCSHGRRLIGRRGLLLPAAELSEAVARIPWAHFVWLTDLSVPAREPLGLTANYSKCDRTAYRYRITEASSVYPWMAIRKVFDWAPELEAAEGARPRHWFVSSVPVPAEIA